MTSGPGGARPRRRGYARAVAAWLLPCLLALAVPAGAQTGPAPVPFSQEVPAPHVGGGAPGQPSTGLTPDRVAPQQSYPHMTVEVDMNLYGIATPWAGARDRQGTSGFLFGHIHPHLHLTPEFSILAFIHPDPAGNTEPAGSATFFRRQNVILEQLYAEWRPIEGVQLFAGKFNAPFGYGHESFPGVLPAFRAHDTYLIREQIGFGAAWELPLPPGWGEHQIAAAVFALDTTLFANSLITRARCCDPAYERYVRTTLSQGGAGNTGNLNNAAIALEGAPLPNLTYNIGLLTRGPGKDGNRREWGWAAGLRYEHAWTEEIRTRLFGELVVFYNADGNPSGEVSNGEAFPTAQRRRFFTLGAQTEFGAWRATLAWQRDALRRPSDPLPTQDWIEVSAGRQIGGGFGLDAGYQYAMSVGFNGGPLVPTHSIIARLNYRYGP